MDKLRLTLAQKVTTALAVLVVIGLLGVVALANIIPIGFRIFAVCWLTYLLSAFLKPATVPSRFQRGVIVVALLSAIVQCFWQFPISDIRYIDDYAFCGVWILFVIWFSYAPAMNWLQRQLAILLFIGGWAAGFFYHVSGGAIGMFATIGIGFHLLVAWPEITKRKRDADDPEGVPAPASSAGRFEKLVTNVILWTVMVMALILIYFSGRPPLWIRRLL